MYWKNLSSFHLTFHKSGFSVYKARVRYQYLNKMPVGFSMWQLVNRNIWGLRIYDMPCNVMYQQQLLENTLFLYIANKMINHACAAISQFSSQNFPNSGGGGVFSNRSTERLDILLVTYLCIRVICQNWHGVLYSFFKLFGIFFPPLFCFGQRQILVVLKSVKHFHH